LQKPSSDDRTWSSRVRVDIKADGRLERPITLAEIKKTPAQAKMVLVQRGSRLSIQPVTADEWKPSPRRSRERKAGLLDLTVFELSAVVLTSKTVP